MKHLLIKRILNRDYSISLLFFLVVLNPMNCSKKGTIEQTRIRLLPVTFTGKDFHSSEYDYQIWAGKPCKNQLMSSARFSALGYSILKFPTLPVNPICSYHYVSLHGSVYCDERLTGLGLYYTKYLIETS